MDRQFNNEQHKKYAQTFYLYMRVLLQEKNSKHKKHNFSDIITNSKYL